MEVTVQMVDEIPKRDGVYYAMRKDDPNHTPKEYWLSTDHRSGYRYMTACHVMGACEKSLEQWGPKFLWATEPLTIKFIKNQGMLVREMNRVNG